MKPLRTTSPISINQSVIITISENTRDNLKKRTLHNYSLVYFGTLILIMRPKWVTNYIGYLDKQVVITYGMENRWNPENNSYTKCVPLNNCKLLTIEV